MSYDLVEEFSKVKDEYNEVLNRVMTLIKNILSENDVRVFDVKGRVKDIDSLKQKIVSKNNKYKELSEISDLCGIRIITYYSDEVDLIAKIIRKELKVIEEVDKRHDEMPNSFGYSSLHFVAEIDDYRANLGEYKCIKGKKFEIQIRTIMEHSWAEIEHDLNYKSHEDNSFEFKRRFSRLASLVELADEEFVALRNEYEATYVKGYADDNVNAETLRSFVENDTYYRGFLDIVKSKIDLNYDLTKSAQAYNNRENQLDMMEYYDFDKIRKDLEKYKDFIIGQLEYRYDNNRFITDTQPLLFMVYAKQCEEDSSELANKFTLSKNYANALIREFNKNKK